MAFMETNGKILSLISLSKKSGNLKSGEEMVLEAIRSEKAHLVIVAGDASENTLKKFKDKTEFFNVPILVISDKDSLGRAIGKEFCASIAIMDGGLARAILDKCEV